jgi:phosphoglycolate phosphatase-like HAD superfamily hydrolase
MNSVVRTPRLVLWDIDQTLIEGGTVTHSAYAAAFQRATGRRLEHPWRFDGRTELAAAAGVLHAHGLKPDGGLLETFIDLIVTELETRADQLAATGHVLPGAQDALDAIGSMPGVHQSVLTGNLYPLAVLKLTLFGLAGYIDTRIGAYGGDAFERCDLPRRALDRARQYLGRRYLGSESVIIGDTRRDMQAASAIGAKAIGVATGTTSVTELYAAGADVVLADLTDRHTLLQAIIA